MATTVRSHYRPVGWFWDKVFSALNIAAIVMPWRVCYYRLDYYYHVVVHEDVHLRQIDRLGPLQFTWLYLYYTLRYGYYNNPLEREACMAEGLCAKIWLPMRTADKNASNVLLLIEHEGVRFCVSGRWSPSLKEWTNDTLDRYTPIAWLPIVDFGETEEVYKDAFKFLDDPDDKNAGA